MKTKRRTEITVETARIFVIRRRRGSILTWCAECAEAVKMVAPDEAAVLAGVNPRTIYRWIEAEKIHFAETPEACCLCASTRFLERYRRW